MRPPIFEVVCGDVIEELRKMPEGSVHCVVTSPPYFALRSYEDHPGQIGLEPTFDAWVQKMVEVFREVRRVLRGDGTCWVNVGQSYAGARSFQGKTGDTDGVFDRRARRLGSLSEGSGPKIFNKKTNGEPEGAVYVGRPSKWGNPFSHLEDTTAEFKVATREEAVSNHEQWIKTQPHLLADLPELEGRDLLCWCAPALCHAQTLRRLANPKMFNVEGDDAFARRDLRQGGLGHGLASGWKNKDLILQGPLLAEALRKDGWYLRSMCTWFKNSMPESVFDRPSNNFEYVFLIAKAERYFFDMEAVRTVTKDSGRNGHVFGRKQRSPDLAGGGVNGDTVRKTGNTYEAPSGANLRSVWEDEIDAAIMEHGIFDAERFLKGLWGEFLDFAAERLGVMTDVLRVANEPFPGGHFATFPTKLVTNPIKSSTSERGCCPHCGAPWLRTVTKGEPDLEHQRSCGSDEGGNYDGTSTKGHNAAGVQDASAVKARILAGMRKRTSTWAPGCACVGPDGQPLEAIPCLVLDPFCMHPDSKIMCVDGIKRIEDVHEGDLVLTHEARYRRVTKVHSRDLNGDLVEIHGKGRRLFATENHPIRVVKTSGGPRQDKALKGGVWGWKEAGSLEIGDLVSFPIYKDTLESSISDSLLSLIGWYLSEGHGTRYATYFYQKKKEILEEIQRLWEIVDPTVSAEVGPKRVAVSSQKWAVFFSQFGSTAPQKRIPLWVKSLPFGKAAVLLRSMFDGDGCLTVREARREANLSYATSSPSLAYDIVQLTSKFGLCPAMGYTRPDRIPIRKVNGRDVIARHVQYRITYGGKDARTLGDMISYKLPDFALKYGNYWEFEGSFVFKVKRSIKRPYRGLVFNLAVEEDESFIADGIAVHNCGSGRTGKASVALGRDFVGVELVSKYAEMARQNIADPEWERKERAKIKAERAKAVVEISIAPDVTVADGRNA